MRTPSTLYLGDLREALGQLRSAESRALAQASSGRRINKPSDDPIGSARATAVHAELQSISASLAAAAHGRAALDSADTSLGALESLVGEAQQLGVQGATDVVPDSERAAIASAIRGASDALLGESNRTLGGYTLFAGGRTQGAAFSRGPLQEFIYQGDDLVREIDLDGNRAALNIPGRSLLDGAVNAGTALEELASAVEVGDVDRTAAALQSVEALRRQISDGRTRIGLASGQLESEMTRINSRTEILSGVLAEVEDADLSEVAIELQRVQTFLGAALAAAGSARRETLFDFLA